MIRPVLLLALLLTACKVGPDYRRPDAIGASGSFKEAPAGPPLSGWTTARPNDAAPKGEWWRIYHDPVLDDLEGRVALNNQNVQAFGAQYREALATVDVARAALFPTVSGALGAQRTARGASGSALTTSSTIAGSAFSSGAVSSGARTTTLYSATASIDWDLDVWGRIRRQIESDVAAAQVSAADLANATLSAQALLAVDYFELRAQDALAKLLTDTVAAYADTVRITQNQYRAGTVAGSDVAAATTQLETARAQLVSVGVSRAQYEHAIAVLSGVAPAALTLSPGTLAADVPVAPAGLPVTLLQRRPDIAAAERAMAQQNALIGVQIAAYFPDISLSALYGFEGNPISSLIQAANRVWSLGAAATDVLFSGGARGAEVAVARAAYDASVATYRQTVLTALQQVEDQLSTLRILERESAALQLAVTSAQRSLAVALNQYRAGTAVYTAVITQQAALLGDQQTLLTVQEQRLVASVTLIQAIGGGYDAAADLPASSSLGTALPFLKYGP